jgi:hypothetical protein
MLRAQACCGFTSFSIGVTKPSGYIRLDPTSIAGIDALRCCHENSLHLRVVNEIYIVVVIDIERAAS